MLYISSHDFDFDGVGDLQSKETQGKNKKSGDFAYFFYVNPSDLNRFSHMRFMKEE